MITGLGRVVFKAFGTKALEIPWMDLGRTKGSKPKMVGTIRVPF